MEKTHFHSDYSSENTCQKHVKLCTMKVQGYVQLSISKFVSQLTIVGPRPLLRTEKFTCL